MSCPIVSFDRRALRAALARLAADCMTSKRLLRSTWTEPMADEQRKLARLRRRATELHVLLAWSRGRLHVAVPPRDAPAGWDARAEAARVAARVAKDFPLPEPPLETRAP